MNNEKIIESLTQLSMDSNARLGRVNEIVAQLTTATIELHNIVREESSRTDRLITIFDKHVSELESSRESTQHELQRFSEHCNRLTAMLEKSQTMHERCLATIEALTHARAPLFVNNGDGNTVSQP